MNDARGPRRCAPSPPPPPPTPLPTHARTQEALRKSAMLPAAGADGRDPAEEYWKLLRK